MIALRLLPYQQFVEFPNFIIYHENLMRIEFEVECFVVLIQVKRFLIMQIE